MRQFLPILFSFFFASVTAQFATLSNQAEVSVLTCGKGNELYSLYGHTALRIHDPANGIDKVYNYGTFDFTTSNFALKFVKGDLQYFVSTSSFEDFLYSYELDQRSVFEQTLDLRQEQKQQLFAKLNSVLLSSERNYTYKFIDRNCTTKVADLLNELIGPKTIEKTGDTERSYREVIYPEFDGHFYEQLGTSIIFGTRVDEKAEKLFLPIELYQSISIARNGNRPLLRENKSWLVFETPPAPFSWWNNAYTYVGLLLIIVFANRPKITLVYFTMVSLLGIFFCIAGWYSYHVEVKWNYNALLFNPLLLGVVIAYGKRDAKGVYLACVLCLGCLGAYLIYMLDKIHLLIVAPLIVTQLVTLLRLALCAKRGLLFSR